MASTKENSMFEAFNRLNLSIQIINSNLEYIFLSDLLLSEIDKTKEEILGKKMLEVFPQLEGSIVIEAIKKCFNREYVEPYINEFQLNGENRYYEVSFELSDGMVVIISKDVTAIKESEKKAIKLSNEIQVISKIGGWKFHLPTQTIDWSIGMYDIFPESTKNGPPSLDKHKSTIHPEDLAQWESTVSKCINEHEAYIMRFRTVHENGDIVWVETKGRCELNQDGEPEYLVGTCQDITDLVDLERIKKQHEQIVEKQKMIESHHSKMMQIGEMSAGFAHEFNNPMAVIAGQVRILKRSLDNPDKVSKSLGTIEKHIVRIKKIMDGLKKLAKKTGEANLEDHSIKEIIDQSIEYLRMLYKNIDFNISVDIEKDFVLKLDEAQIVQALYNLVSNSIDSVKDQGWIRIKVFEENNEINILVQDSGKPIPNEIQDLMFTPFYTTKEFGHGNGLGLGLALSVFQAHNGRLYYEPINGQPTFTATLPL